MILLYLVWMFLKLARRKGEINPSSCLDVLKIRMERRKNDLNRQIYPYLKIDLPHPTKKKKKKKKGLQHWFMINLLVL